MGSNTCMWKQKKKKTQQSFTDFPCRQDVAECRDSLKMCFRAETCLTTLDLDMDSEWGKLVNV